MTTVINYIHTCIYSILLSLSTMIETISFSLSLFSMKGSHIVTSPVTVQCMVQVVLDEGEQSHTNINGQYYNKPPDTVNVDIFDVDLFSRAVNSRKLNSCEILTTCILYCACSFSPN